MTLSLRKPSEVMRLQHLGASFPNCFSFMRILMKRLVSEGPSVFRTKWDVDAEGYGQAVYQVQLGSNIYSLIAFSEELTDDERSDRVISEKWDTTYVLFDGIPTEIDLKRLAQNVPKQEKGRYTSQELVLSRANKSVRAFKTIVECLQLGQAFPYETLQLVGYLMRTTAVYGNGKFGLADRIKYANRPEFCFPFQAELLAVWLIRGFTHDLVEHIAKQKKSHTFRKLSVREKRSLGIGNSTGLGMAPFLVNHPILTNNWMMVREIALTRILNIKHIESAIFTRMQELLEQANEHLQEWNEMSKQSTISQLQTDWKELQQFVKTSTWKQKDFPWKSFWDQVNFYTVDCQGLALALLLELYEEENTDLMSLLSTVETMPLSSEMSTDTVIDLLETYYDWALKIDFSKPQSTCLFWYISEEKWEPRLGDRAIDDGAEKERPLDIARQINNLYSDLYAWDGEKNSATFLLHYPQYRSVLRRIQNHWCYPYAEIHDNLIDINCIPINILRFKLSCLGATKFDPRSDRWLRVNLYQYAPLFEDVQQQLFIDGWLKSAGNL